MNEIWIFDSTADTNGWGWIKGSDHAYNADSFYKRYNDDYISNIILKHGDELSCLGYYKDSYLNTYIRLYHSKYDATIQLSFDKNRDFYFKLKPINYNQYWAKLNEASIK